METLYLKLNGLSQLLMHNPAGSMKPGGGQRLGRKTIPSPEAEAEASRYLLPDGHFYVPAIAVRNCLLNGSKGYRIGKIRAMDLLAGAILMVDEAFPLLRNGEPIPGKDYSIDERRAVVQKQGIIRARARIELGWQLECAFGYNSTLANLEQIKEIAQNAGQVVGLLDYRPEKKGWFGRFEVIEIRSE